MGYLHAVPTDQPKSRLDEMKDRGETDFGLPKLMEGEYLHVSLFDIGPTRSNGMGEVPTDWDIITPFAEANGYDSEDASILFEMCRGYLSSHNTGKNPLAIPPAEQE